MSLCNKSFPYQSTVISAVESHESIQRFSPEQNKQLYEELLKIVDQHNTAIDMCKRTSQIMWLNVLIHFVTSAFCICICCLMTLLSDGVNKMLFANYVAVATIQVLIYSIGGNMLGEASTNIRQSAYNFHWYKCDGKVRKLILMIMNRTQKKTVIEVPFFEVHTTCFWKVTWELSLNFHSFLPRSHWRRSYLWALAKYNFKHVELMKHLFEIRLWEQQDRTWRYWRR